MILYSKIQQGLRRSKRLADQEEAHAHHENSENDADSEADDPDTPGSSPSAHSESSGNEDEGNIQDKSSDRAKLDTQTRPAAHRTHPACLHG